MTYLREYAETPRYAYRMTKAGPQAVVGQVAERMRVTVRCAFCVARYQAIIGPRIPCPVCGRVEAER